MIDGRVATACTSEVAMSQSVLGTDNETRSRHDVPPINGIDKAGLGDAPDHDPTTVNL